ncbi:AlpA family transcriptional regulator [Undibacterium sp.]|uniref:helix-turn-helix transcriptional regulator n=1 Tax=Undibacterium sp. TaxID=1914977 RepID=UPI0025FC0244|nr:AlpA family transcriptional regulator [Undibacterium sp.]
MTNQKTSPARLLRLPSVLDRVPFSKTEIYRRVRAGDFPKPISIGIRAVAWLESDIDQYIQKLTTGAAQ